jgi:hypothetical protein
MDQSSLEKGRAGAGGAGGGTIVVADMSAFVNLPQEILYHMFQWLDGPHAVACSQASRKWAIIGEMDFQRRCSSRGWVLPRRPRGLHASSTTPWKCMYLSKSCKGCHGQGTFPVLGSGLGNQSTVAYLCRRCALDSDPIRQVCWSDVCRGGACVFVYVRVPPPPLVTSSTGDYKLLSCPLPL